MLPSASTPRGSRLMRTMGMPASTARSMRVSAEEVWTGLQMIRSMPWVMKFWIWLVCSAMSFLPSWMLTLYSTVSLLSSPKYFSSSLR